MMHKLISEYGNEIVYTDNARQIGRLLELGFRIVDDVSSTPKQPGEKGKRKHEANKNRTGANLRRIPQGQ